MSEETDRKPWSTDGIHQFVLLGSNSITDDGGRMTTETFEFFCISLAGVVQ